jgi:hypothetical protein
VEHRIVSSDWAANRERDCEDGLLIVTGKEVVAAEEEEEEEVAVVLKDSKGMNVYFVGVEGDDDTWGVPPLGGEEEAIDAMNDKGCGRRDRR